MVDQIDIIKLDVPLLIRILELVNENKFSDAELHVFVENIIKSSKIEGKDSLNMDNYQELINGLNLQNDGTIIEEMYEICKDFKRRAGLAKK